MQNVSSFPENFWNKSNNPICQFKYIWSLNKKMIFIIFIKVIQHKKMIFIIFIEVIQPWLFIPTKHYKYTKVHT